MTEIKQGETGQGLEQGFQDCARMKTDRQPGRKIRRSNSSWRGREFQKERGVVKSIKYPQDEVEENTLEWITFHTPFTQPVIR